MVKCNNNFAGDSWKKRGDNSKRKEADIEYLRPNRYFKFYLFRQKGGNTTCWLPEGFSA